jgi:hypothetical protein
MNELCFSGNLKIPFLDTALTRGANAWWASHGHSLQILNTRLKKSPMTSRVYYYYFFVSALFFISSSLSLL